MDYIDEGLIKEKDLQNHLEAVPDKSPKEQPEAGEKEEGNQKREIEKTKFMYGKLTPEILETDNQVMRALDILLSYEIFKDVNK
jgi:carboxyl-terminal processing protease